ncbi:MAG: hypothetical protein ACPGVD_00595 [Flavobacteriales bacterium]
MEKEELVSDLLFELKDLGYTQKLEIKEGNLFFPPKHLTLKPTDLFFIDAGFKIKNETLIFAINSPLYDLKAYLEISKDELEELKVNGYSERFDLAIKEYSQDSPAIVIERQYDMRKVAKKDFDSNRYELRVGFPDFPPCPYGHTFKALGYDLKTEEYVRLSPVILKKEEIKTIKYEK